MLRSIFWCGGVIATILSLAVAPAAAQSAVHAAAQEQEQDRAMASFLLGNCNVQVAKLANQVQQLTAKLAEMQKAAEPTEKAK